MTMNQQRQERPQPGGSLNQQQNRQHEAFLTAIQKRSAAPGGYGGSSGGAIGQGGDYRDYARQKLAQMGFGDAGQWDALNRLWEKESNWNPNAVNRSSGAFGIAQILPSAHPNARRDMDGYQQIDWGLDYILRRYGNPLAAWQHSQRTDWY